MMIKNNHQRALMFYDIKGWAWWHKINNIAANQPSDIKIDSIKPGSDCDHI
jgi:hypothetical protein